MICQSHVRQQYHEGEDHKERAMSEQATLSAVVRRAGEGHQRWFFGGGVFTWKLTSVETGGELSVFEVELDGGKRTPLHTHPIAESLWVLDGHLRYRIDTDDVDIQAGDFVMVPSGIPHAFLVLSEHARLISIQPSGACEPFYLGASEPIEGSARETDFTRLAQSAAANGGIEIVGPPPF
jgi:quercetin dioxygenase-like cupin family protein